MYNHEIEFIINSSLLFFFARMLQLICQINPLFQELFLYLKSKGFTLEDKKIKEENYKEKNDKKRDS